MSRCRYLVACFADLRNDTTPARSLLIHPLSATCKLRTKCACASVQGAFSSAQAKNVKVVAACRLQAAGASIAAIATDHRLNQAPLLERRVVRLRILCLMGNALSSGSETIHRSCIRPAARTSSTSLGVLWPTWRLVPHHPGAPSAPRLPSQRQQGFQPSAEPFAHLGPVFLST